MTGPSLKGIPLQTYFETKSVETPPEIFFSGSGKAASREVSWEKASVALRKPIKKIKPRKIHLHNFDFVMKIFSRRAPFREILPSIFSHLFGTRRTPLRGPLRPDHG